MVIIFLTHTLCLRQMAMINPQDPMTQQKRNTKQTTQGWKSKIKPKATAKKSMNNLKTRMETVNQQLNMETTINKLINTTM